MPTVMHERGAATQYPRGIEGISTAKTLALEEQINNSFIIMFSLFFLRLFHIFEGHDIEH